MAMNTAEKARIAGRKEAVKAGVAKGLTAKESRKRYYVRTRVGELEKAGKPVSAEKRKQLREKFNSGDVSRRGFAAPKKQVKAIELPQTTSPVSKSRPPSGGRGGRTSTMPGSSSSSSSSASTKKGRSGGGKVYDFARNELLGVDDFGRVGKNLRKGNYGKAAKSAGAGVLELGSTVASIFGVGLGVKGLMGVTKAAKVVKGAKAAKGAKTVSNAKYYKNLATGNQAKNYKNLAGTAVKGKKVSSAKYYKNLATGNQAKNYAKPVAKSVAKSGAKTTAKTGAKSTAKTGAKTTKAQKASAARYYKNLATGKQAKNYKNLAGTAVKGKKVSNAKYYKNIAKGKNAKNYKPAKTPFMKRPNGRVMNTAALIAPSAARLSSNYLYNEDKRKRSRLLG